MDWEDYRHVLALARTRSSSAAADSLGVVRTTVSRRLAAMEDALGVRLFDRTPEGLVPTPAGEELVAVAARMEDEVLAAEARVRGRDAELRGALRVSTLDFVYELFPRAFASFVERYPHVTLMVSASTDQVSLRRREADVVLRLNDKPPNDLVGRRLRKLEFGVYASRKLVDRIGEGASLAAFPWIGDDDRLGNSWMDAWLAHHAPGARVVLRHDAYAVMRAALRDGVGAHMLPTLEAERDPIFVPIAPDLPPITRDLWALTLPELATSSRVRAFLDHVYEHVGEG
ncbi:MAG: LysR family transcriptional regulator [Sandaracinus sp.]|nr:LysR family transcriptional regulator [Sandaracinus sp.]MCB9619678.1 LysR family transcriptional regulator [Sandaracinus sp.]MCB9634385.1 LysR family transcriptional regulator [Sandaracinus sp.]